ncbi:MAG: dihydrodipicolinate reductase [Aquabacterium sp.]|uniref:dihydrodipicolinate reductase C-terminal domain-containing protein n=1 Tax=Aquabacterium sp. TaxID=1872578 RepID=UPI00121435D8|nr:dihydrodipicolinate reductase C-terminal domain-containing protein [Aquabacterium sp.]TAK89409.1 MAG: dihydrodipicolinate reductase [Aquabacterium sp.]
MQVIIAGTGKLATELCQLLSKSADYQVKPWADRPRTAEQAIVVHAGSGRELEDIVAYCEATRSTLLELSTGSRIESMSCGFPVVLCPNTNILMLKFMAMLEQAGPMFRPYAIQVMESHQATKTSVPGTAVNIAHSLGVATDDIHSVRDPEVQKAQCQIADADLARHAYHQILIQDGPCSVKLETRVFGDAPYAHGVDQIIKAAMTHELENRCYPVMTFIQQGWL